MRSLNKGFTLLELLFAASIMAFTLTGLLTLFITTMFLNQSNRNTTIATSHAEHVMEEIKNTNFLSIYSTFNSMSRSGSAITTQWSPINNLLRNETISTSVSVSAGTIASPLLLDVTVNVSWNDRGSRTREPVVLRTFMAEQ